MKKVFILFAFLSLMTSATFAQRLAFVNSDYVLKHIPEYNSAQKQLDDLSKDWQDEVDNRYAEIERLYKAYQNDQVLLNDANRRKREDEIVGKEKEVKDFQRQKFGYDGELFKERTRLIGPIQQQVERAIQDIAKNQGLDLILDKGSELAILYSNPNLDKSNDVIVKLGFKPNPNLLEN